MSRAPLLLALVVLSGGAARAQDADAPMLEIEEFEPVDSTSASEASPQPESDSEPIRARVYGSVRGRAGVDTRFDSARGDPLAENVFDLSTRAVLGVDAKLSSSVRVVAEARGWWRASAERAFDRPKGMLEVDVGEAFVDLYTPRFDLRVGNQLVAFGANPAFAPADQLNPRELRESLLLGEFEDGKLPHLGVRALGSAGRVTWTAAYFPFFKAHRYALTGQDEGFAQPALEMAPDELEPLQRVTERPRALPWLGDLGLRATLDAGPISVGASWIWVNEKLPTVTLDPELSRLVRDRALGVDPDPALIASLRDRALTGEQLASGLHGRQHVMSLEAQALIGTAQLDVDLSWSPAQTFFDAGLQPTRHQTLSWVVGLSQASESPLLYNVTWLGLAVPGPVWFQALLGTVGYRFLTDRLEVSVRAAVEPIRGSWALSPRVVWKGFARTSVGVTAEFYEGHPWSPFGYFGRNDQVVALFSTDLF